MHYLVKKPNFPLSLSIRMCTQLLMTIKYLEEYTHTALDLDISTPKG